jgi:hypothetical protein
VGAEVVGAEVVGAEVVGAEVGAEVVGEAVVGDPPVSATSASTDGVEETVTPSTDDAAAALESCEVSDASTEVASEAEAVAMVTVTSTDAASTPTVTADCATPAAVAAFALTVEVSKSLTSPGDVNVTTTLFVAAPPSSSSSVAHGERRPGMWADGMSQAATKPHAARRTTATMLPAMSFTGFALGAVPSLGWTFFPISRN